MESDLFFDNNILDTIASAADIDTQRILKEVCKHFRDSIKTPPTFGRLNAEYLLKYIKLNSGNVSVILKYIKLPNIFDDYPSIKIEIQHNHDINKIVIIRHRMGEVDDVIGLYKYNKLEDLQNITIRDIVKKQKLRYLSRFLFDINKMDMYYYSYQPYIDINIILWHNYVIKNFIVK